MKKSTIIAYACYAGTLLLLLTQASSCACTSKSAQAEVRNVIYMIGDGMGVGHVSALMLDNGYAPINMERAQAVGLVKTYSANNRVTDSAAAGTALATGHKTNNSRLGMDPEGNVLESIMMKASGKGFGTGLVVTCSITDATPGAFYANVKYRREHETIAEQLTASGIDVFVGGGRKYFNKREDGVDLTATLSDNGYEVVTKLEQLEDAEGDKVAALLHSSSFKLYNEGRDDYLPRAVEKTLDILSRNDKGFMMMVEGSLIDGQSHRHHIQNILGEMGDFDRAVGVAFDFADRNPGTLVVVLADHETSGLSLVPGDADFEKAESGVSANFGTGGHTAALIPMMAYGAGAENFTGIFENTDIPKIIESLMMPQAK